MAQTHDLGPDVININALQEGQLQGRQEYLFNFILKEELPSFIVGIAKHFSANLLEMNMDAQNILCGAQQIHFTTEILQNSCCIKTVRPANIKVL